MKLNIDKINLLTKFHFWCKKPPVIIVTGEGRFCVTEAINKVLAKCNKEVMIFETELQTLENFKSLIKKSSLPILVVTQIDDILREKTIQIRKLAKILPVYGYLILSFDDEAIREIKNESSAQPLTFGFQQGADFQASDIKLNDGTNFKINYKGNIIPVWLEKMFGKEQIYSALAATSVGTIFDLNLVEISQALKNYHSISLGA